jgi:ABC-type transport system substrate-binding protein
MANYKKVSLMLLLVMLLTLTMLPLNITKAQDETLFEVTIIAPGNANMLRRQWGQIIANSLIQLGIDARVVYLDWVPVIDRVFEPAEENVGKTYDEGGFDIQLIGWTPGMIPEPSQLYYGSPEAFAPNGSNYPLFNNTEANDLMDIFLTTTNTTERDEVAKKFQTLFYNELPASQIMYLSTPTAVTPELGGPALGTSPGGEGWLYFNAQPNPEMLAGKTEVVYCSTGEIESLIPTCSNSWYDTIVHANIFGGLVMVQPDLSDLTVPNLLTSWVPSNNGFKWTYTCRTGVKWHDGADFTADDVVFSLWALMNPAVGSQHVGSYTIAFGDNVKFTYANGTSTTLGTGTRVGNVTAVDATTVEFWLPELLPGKPYGYFDPYLLGFANNIIPKHILEKIPPAEWEDSPLNLGEGSIDIGGTTYTGPVGTGPYKWVDYDPVAQIIHLEKNLNYWNRTALEADGVFGVTDYYIRFIADKTPALAALKNEEVDMLDPQYQIQVDVPTIDPSWGKVLLNEGTGRQEVGYNHQHPILGTGVDTPLGQSDPSRAAEAAKYVRIALDYAIPRQLIIDNLLAGYGQPGATYWLPTHPFYNASITARPYDLSMAKEYLGKAGYGAAPPPPKPTFPSFILGMSAAMSGIYTDADGNPLANRELSLWVTTDNATYDTTSEMIGRTTTDLSGWYSFTVTPTSTGTFYYYLFDRLATVGTEWTYVTMLDVSSVDDALDPLYDLIADNSQTLQSQSDTLDTLSSQIGSLQGSITTLMYASVAAIVIAVVIGAIAIYMARKGS